MVRLTRVSLLLLPLLACDGGLEPRPALNACPTGFVGICGTVKFRGDVPESTQAVYVIAYDTFPDSREDLFKLQPPILLLEPLPLDDTVAFYTVRLTGRRYEWVLAAWVKDGFALDKAETHLFEAGYYRNPADTTLPGVVLIPNGGSADSIDFVVDFEHLDSVSVWFPAQATP
jgi:hypothetical protein